MNAPAFYVGSFKLQLVERKIWQVIIAERGCRAELKTLVAHKYNVDDEEEWQIHHDGETIARGENLYELLEEARDVLTARSTRDMMAQEGRTE